MNIAIIPARGGSKRIPKKNIKNFAGAPIISYSIQAAINSKLFEHIIVSTDDDKIFEIAKKYGAEVPFIRPKQLSDDYSGADDVVVHAIDWCKQQQWSVENVCCIYATAPLITSEDISNAYEVFLKNSHSYVFTATTYNFPVQRSFIINENSELKMLFANEYHTRSQDLDNAYHDAGQFYWAKDTTWLSKKEVFSGNSIPFLIARKRVQDIDTEEDWELAELMYQLINRKNYE